MSTLVETLRRAQHEVASLVRMHGHYEPDEPVVNFLASVMVDGASSEAGAGACGRVEGGGASP